VISHQKALALPLAAAPRCCRWWSRTRDRVAAGSAALLVGLAIVTTGIA
jgi:hypothetical protein